MQIRLNTVSRLLFAIMLVVLLNLLADVTSKNGAAAVYDCDSFGGEHCFAIHKWFGATSGAKTSIRVRSVIAGNAVLAHDLWLVDKRSTGQDWVEAGYLNTANDSQGTRYFWGDARPGAAPFILLLSQVPAADIGSSITIQFWKNPTSFSVVMNSPNFYYSAYSTPNQMNADEIHIGIELGGTSGASSPTAQYSNNYWRDFSSNWRVQTRNGDIDHQDIPPRGNWQTLPSNSPTGGVWQAWCCN